jgi:hypothetical protein
MATRIPLAVIGLVLLASPVRFWPILGLRCFMRSFGGRWGVREHGVVGVLHARPAGDTVR